jgi:hypothetical protein
MNQVLIRIPMEEVAFITIFPLVKAAIVACINRNCGIRLADVLFFVKMGSEEVRFVIRKTVDLGSKSSEDDS